MATSIELEPKNYVTPNSKQKKDKHDNKILFEGTHDRESVFCIFGCVLLFLVVLTVGIVILLLPLYFTMCFCNFKSWRLYLTRSAIYHTYIPNSGMNVWKREWVIPLRDIKDIFVMSGCGSTDIAVVVGNKVFDYIPPSQHHLIDNQNCLLVSNVKNREEFVEAAKKAIGKRKKASSQKIMIAA